MQDSQNRNINDINIQKDSAEWIVNLVGLSVAVLDFDGNVQFNIQAQSLLGLESGRYRIEKLYELFHESEGFENFLSSLKSNSGESELIVLFSSELKRLKITGNYFFKQKQTILVLTWVSKSNDEKSDELLHELERHESQLAITVSERSDEINRLNQELGNYRKELQQLMVSHHSKLNESEARLKTLSDNLPNGAIFRFKYFHKESKLKLLYIGNYINELFDKPLEQFESKEKAFFDLVHPNDKTAYLKAISSISNKNGRIDLEFRVVGRTNRDKWLYLRAQPNGEVSDDVIFWDGFIFDISTKKELEKKLHLSQTSIDKSNDPVYWFTKDSKIVYVNEAATAMLGYSKEEFLAINVYNLSKDFTKKNWAKGWDNISKVRSTTIETEHIRKDGSLVPVEIKANYFTYNKEEYVFAIVADITQRKEINAKILYRQQLESFIVDISTRFINVGYKDVDLSISRALKEICLFSKTETSYIYFFDEAYKEMSLIHNYNNDKTISIHEQIHQYPVDANYWHFKQIISEGSVQKHSLIGLPEDDLIAYHCRKNGIHSFINVALYYQNKFLGFFGVASQEEGRYWDKDELKLLQVVGDIFVGAIKRKQAVQSLLESENTYREIFNVSTDAIIIHEIDTGRILDVNQATLDMFELRYDEALTLTASDLTFNSDAFAKETALELIRLASKEPNVFEYQSKKFSGEELWCEVSLKKADIHGMDRVMAVVRDISKRKNSETLLRESEEKYRMIVEGQNDLMVKVNIRGEFLFVSPSYCRLFGKTEAEILGGSFNPTIHKEDKETTMMAMEKLYNAPHTCFFEQRSKTKDGWRWLAWNDTAILDEDNQIKEIIGVGRDITYQKMVENALRESEDRFRSIVQNLSNVVFLLDERANIKYVTPSSEEYIGLAVEELLGLNIIDLIHPDDKIIADENIQFHINGNDYNVPYEIRMQHHNKSYKVFEVKSHSLLNHPSVRSIIYTISDITERKIMEKQVLDAIIKTEEKERERFAKDLHDDLGPLLSSVKMYVGMLGKSKDEEKQNYIIKNLTDIVKEAIATTKEVSNDLNPHVLNNYGLYSALELFIDKVSTEVEIEFNQDIDSTRYKPAIELSVYRICKELINNSIKHSEATKIKIKLKEKNLGISLVYSDNGKGLSDKALTSRPSGGMGLSNIVSRAKSLNAIYNFHTNSQKGFKFDLNVPLNQD